MRSILIVEDSPVETAIYRKLLKEDFRLAFADSAERALKIVESTPFDLLISDVNLPGISGVEMISQVREIDMVKGMGVVVVSSDQQGIKSAMASGANAWFMKPISPRSFLASIWVVIDKFAS